MTVAFKLDPLRTQLLADGANCSACPLGRGGVPGRPVATDWQQAFPPPVAIVGELPGRREVLLGRPFIGPSGALLDQACAQSGVLRPQKLAILNAAACGPIPSHDDAAKQATVAACRPRLLAELRRLQPKVILTVGAYALRALSVAGTAGVTAARGALVGLAPDAGLVPAPFLIPTLHPAHILRGGDGEADTEGGGEGGRGVDLLYFLFQADLAKSVQLAEGRIKPWEDNADLFAWGAPRHVFRFVDEHGRARTKEGTRPEGLYRVGTMDDGTIGWGDRATPAEFVEAVEDLYTDAHARGVFAADVETDGKDNLACTLTAIGVATVDGGLSATWEAWRRVPEALALLTTLFADRALRVVFQNAPYDRPVLARHAIATCGHVEDTLLQHHGAFPGLPHGLDAIAQQWFVTVPWKAQFRRGTRDLPSLIVYNYRDAQATSYLEPVLHEALRVRRTERVYEVDRQLSTVATRMRVFGYFVDRAEQSRLSKALHARLDWMRATLTMEFKAIEGPWRRALAEVMATRVRKADAHLDYMERVERRFTEIAKRKYKETDIGFFKPKAKLDLVALFRVLAIPVAEYTEKTNLPVTDKKAMELAAARHPLFRRLNSVREVMNTLAMFVDGLPIGADGRVHPDWKVWRITGRWAAGKAQNIQYNIPGWPPEEEIDPDARLSALAPAAPAPAAALPMPCGLSVSHPENGLGVQGAAIIPGSETGVPGVPAATGFLSAGAGYRRRTLLQGFAEGAGVGGAVEGKQAQGAAETKAPAPAPGYRWKKTPSGEFVCPRENPRAQITAPTALEILALYENALKQYGDVFKAVNLAGGQAILDRARAGVDRVLVGADFGQLELRIAGYLASEPFLINGFSDPKWDPHSHFGRVCFAPSFGAIETEFAGLGLKPKVDLDTVAFEKIAAFFAYAEAHLPIGARDTTGARVRLGKMQKQWKRLRDLAKRCEYGAIYGGLAVNLYEVLVKDFPELRLADVEATVRLIEREMPAVVAQRRRWEQEARIDREIRDAFLGRVRLFPLGHFDPQIVYNYPIQTASASLLAFGIFRFVAVTQPALLDLERLYRFKLLDRQWVARWQMRVAADPWHTPPELIINGHDSLIAEMDGVDGARGEVLLADAMTQTYTHTKGHKMTFLAEAARGRRWNDT